MATWLRPIALSVTLALAGGLGAGCTPRCQDSCSKVLDCDLGSTRVARDECVLSCQIQQTTYREWDDEVKKQAFREHRRCIRASTCEEIAEGACYDEELFLFSESDPSDGESTAVDASADQ